MSAHTVCPTLSVIPGGWSSQTVQIGPHRFELTVPADPDAFLDDPQVQEAHERDQAMPYWPYLWPAAVPLAEAIVRGNWQPRAKALEIGAGIGLISLAAAARRLDATVSDYESVAVNLAIHNARANGFADVEPLVLDWRKPVPRQFDVIFGSDVVYEARNHDPILDLLGVMLAPRGICWIGDAGRQLGGAFYHRAVQRGYDVALFDAAGAPLAEPHVGRFQLIVVEHKR